MDKCPTCGKVDVKWKDMEAIEWAIKTLGLDEANEDAIRKAIAGEGRLECISDALRKVLFPQEPREVGEEKGGEK